ncbi:SDR family NAD(P)-dependent oxidoreductase [Algicella marina]|uniref:SDR family NAD(P)-dependent oxidoreductase n=1 Tax=Algicella marina TaxID=2683284 RepID=A0A6P1T6D3_9RHOB|nr:SDR family NAD(P)-dependent oxidoreductase [Algicella marina]
MAVITGAGAGLGRALSLRLAAAGLTVAGLGRRLEPLEETGAAADGRFVPIVADVADAAAVRAAFAQIDTLGGDIAILINNAAIYERFDFLAEPPEVYMRSVNVNLGGTIACCHQALSRMVERGNGRIVNVTTFADLAPLPGSSAYSVSKGAGRIFTRALIADMGDRFPDIVINDWIPGALATQMGIADGIVPEQAAAWGAELALQHDRSLMGTLFDRDREVLPPRSLKGRIRDLVLFQPKRVARVMNSA